MLSWRRTIAAGRVLLMLACLGLTGCARVGPAPVAREPETGGRVIVVSVDTWHAMIAFPLSNGGFEEWGYAEQAWYLEGRQGLAGALRALLWPTPAVVEVTVSDTLWAERTPQPPADVFVLRIGEGGYRQLRDHLAATLADPEPVAVLDGSRFYRARRAYHLFHQCHHYAARALAAAGLPVAPASAFTRSAFAAELERLAAP
jgi:Protein of unknown function (DUF2459)